MFSFLVNFIPGVGPILSFVTTYWRFFVFLALLGVIGVAFYEWHARGDEIAANMVTISAQSAEISTLQANLKEVTERAAIQQQAEAVAEQKTTDEAPIVAQVQTLSQEASHATPKYAVDPAVSDALAGIAKLRVVTSGPIKPHH